MTDAQHKDIINSLCAEGFYNININKDVIFCEFMVEGHLIKLRCALPSTFPYELPTIYIEKGCYENISPLPHINSDLSICTFDKATVIPNFKFPKQIILASIIQAKLIVSQGISKENLEDFYEEFSAYWQLECDALAESIVESSNFVKTVKCYFAEKKVYLADNKMQLDNYLTNVGINKRYEKDYYDCIHLPLSINLKPPFPKTNYDLYCLIKSDTVNFEVYNKFLRNKIPKGAFVAFSMAYNKNNYIQLWMHTGISTTVNGFRKGHAPVGISYLKDTKRKTPLKFFVEDMSQERLFTRGGSGLTNAISKVAVIGCGSVGSYIIEALSEYGVDSFVLVDNEKLSIENIARHYCGYEYVGMNKASAISAKLRKHNPNIRSEVYNENGLTFIDSHTDLLNNCDVIFIATASTPLEYKVVDSVCHLKIRKTVVLSWVEPYVTAAHAIILKKPQNIFDDLFDADYIFNQRVITNGTSFLMKEAGCQSTFIPYAAFSLKRYIYDFLDYLVFGNILKEKTGNYLFTWCGDILNAQRKGCKIASSWSNANNYSIHIKRVD